MVKIHKKYKCVSPQILSTYFIINYVFKMFFALTKKYSGVLNVDLGGSYIVYP